MFKMLIPNCFKHTAGAAFFMRKQLSVTGKTMI